MLVFILLFLLSNILSVSAAGWYKGDLHVHTELSSWEKGCVDEFNNMGGNTIGEIRTAIHQANYDTGGIWISITDHSYCLDSSEWTNTIVADSNANTGTFWGNSFLFMPSEEVSVEESCADIPDEGLCGLGFDQAGHLGAQGISSFIDSEGNEWCPESPTSYDAINEVNNGGISIINHPSSTNWDWESLGIHGGAECTNGETGLEIWNEKFESDDQETLNIWIDHLLEGEKIYAFSGSDSHEPNSGAPLTPTAKIGDVWNYAYFAGSFNQAGLETALSSGRNTVSNNGLVYLEVKGQYQSDWTLQGDTTNICSGENVKEAGL